MITIISPSDATLYRIGQKLLFLVEYVNGVNITWSLDNTLIISSNSIAEIEISGIKTINGTIYNYCITRLIDSGDFYLKAISDAPDSGEFTATIYGIDLVWVGAKTGIWSPDVGQLCYGTTVNFDLQRINKWSLFKPIRSSVSNLGNRDIWSSSNLFKQNGAGMKLNIWDSVRAPVSFTTYMNSIILPGDTSWDYLNPRGEAENEYFRLGDFRGYTEHWNTSYLKEISADPTIYRLKTTKAILKENWDNYTLENNEIPGSMLMSDIWTNTNASSNLGEYYLMVYVIDNTSQRRFFKAIKKLSDQANGTFNINTPLEELYADTDLLGNNKVFENKGVLIRYYFIANEVRDTSNWVELTDTYNSQVPTEYAPNTVRWRYNYLSFIFKDALPVPLSNNLKNYKVQNNIIFYTEIIIRLKNEYHVNRHISVSVLRDSTPVFDYFKEFTDSETKDAILSNITSSTHGELRFNDVYKEDVIKWQLGNPVIYTNYFRPTTENPTEIYLNLEEAFYIVGELSWNTNIPTVTLYEEFLNFNFYNNASSTTDIKIELLEYTNGSILTLANGANSSFKHKNTSVYKFKNLMQYKFKVTNLDNLEIGDIITLTISSDSPEKFTFEESHNDSDNYITLNITVDLGDGYFSNSLTPLNVDITMIF